LLILVLGRPQATDSTRQQIHDFYLANIRFINNWELGGRFGPSLVGAYLMDKSRRPLYRLAKSTSVWERRIAIVATQHFHQERRS